MLPSRSPEAIKEKFRRWDRNGDGVISRAELGHVLGGLGMQEEEIDMIFRAADVKENGVIEYDEFVEWLYELEPDPGERSFRLTNNSISTSHMASAVHPGSLGVVLFRGRNVPKLDWFSESDPYVIIEVSAADGTCLAYERSHCVTDDPNPVWNQVLSLPPARGSRRTKRKGVPPACWDPRATMVNLRVIDQDLFFDDFAGHCTLPLLDFIEKAPLRLKIWDKAGEAVLASSPPYMPCEVALAVVAETLPTEWPRPEPPKMESYPFHVFMMTRGTRGDVQPFVALARGMAEERGWLVTICTELRWKSFVKANAKVSRGRIRFRPSGGDTEARMDSWIGKLVLESRSDLMQMVVMACSEAEFFGSATVFLAHVLEMEDEGPRPVDLLVFGLTVARVAALVSELCDKALIGFILQPSIIPSSDEEWSAVQPVRRNQEAGSGGRKFTSHSALRFVKGFVEESGFARYNLDHLRKSFGLEVTDTWDTLKRMKVPLVIPMREGTFPRPSDWWDSIDLTDFIFLRGGAAAPGALAEPLAGFVAAARAAGAKLGLMTFSSMPVPRRLVVACCVRMVEECSHNLRLIFVGRLQGNNTVPGELALRADALKAEHRLCEVERADFGALFREMDCFVVHGGLGTTVEALRRKKPVCVTGPLLMDQRFWGNVCYQKGVGPEPVVIEDFGRTCVAFADGALDPADPQGWQANAREQFWGEDSDDGVHANVEHFARLAGQNLATMSTKDLSAMLLPLREASSSFNATSGTTLGTSGASHWREQLALGVALAAAESVPEEEGWRERDEEDMLAHR